MPDHIEKNGTLVRAAAAQVIAEVLGGRNLYGCLVPHLEACRDPRDRALLHHLCYGTLRWLPRLQAVLKRMIQRPLQAKDLDISALLAVGLFQLEYSHVPPHAAIATTVEAARMLEKPWAVSMINGVLRNFQRRRDALLAEADADPASRFAHPPWLLKKLRAIWPQDWQHIAEANNTQPPMTLRVNLRQYSREAYLDLLAEHEIEATPALHSTAGIILTEARDVYSLPGFSSGAVSVQDEAAQFAAFLLNPPSGARVLDACAAPGGKSAHLLEQYPDIELTALDSSSARLLQISENLTRLQLSASVLCGDAGELSTWWDGRFFERILLDAPCTASGVIRRHPDSKYLRRPHDDTTLAAQQARLLDALWQTLMPNGVMLYVTCSLWPTENALQIQSFLQRHGDAEAQAITADWGRAMDVGRQVLPGEKNRDGFYYAGVRKHA